MFNHKGTDQSDTDGGIYYLIGRFNMHDLMQAFVKNCRRDKCEVAILLRCVLERK